jgi:hypothetical protein
MGTCKTCGGAVFASGEVVGYAGATCTVGGNHGAAATEFVIRTELPSERLAAKPYASPKVTPSKAAKLDQESPQALLLEEAYQYGYHKVKDGCLVKPLIELNHIINDLITTTLTQHDEALLAFIERKQRDTHPMGGYPMVFSSDIVNFVRKGKDTWYEQRLLYRHDGRGALSAPCLHTRD